MEFTINTETFKEKLALTSNFVATGTVEFPITKCIYIKVDADKNCATLHAADFTHGCKVRIRDNIKVKTSGEFVIEGMKFIRLVNTIQGGELNFRLKRHQLKIKEMNINDYNDFTMLTTNGPDKFPSIPTPGNRDIEYKIKKDDFLDLVKLVKFAAVDPKRADPDVKAFSEMIFFTDDLIYATNTEKFGGILKPDTSLAGLKLPKNSLSYFKNLSDTFTLHVGSDIFYISDGDYFFMVRAKSVDSPTSSVKRILSPPDDIAVKYQLTESESKRIIQSLKQIRILNEYVVVYITDSKMWLAGVDYEDSASRELHTSVKGISLTPDVFEREIRVTFKISYFMELLKAVDEPELIFEGGFQDANAFMRVYKGEFQGLIQRAVSKFEDKIVEKIKEKVN